MRLFTYVYICDLFVLKFTYHLIDSIFDAYAIYASPVGFAQYLKIFIRIFKNFLLHKTQNNQVKFSLR